MRERYTEMDEDDIGRGEDEKDIESVRDMEKER